MLDSWLSRYRRWDLDEPIAVLTVRPDRNATALYLRRRPGRPLAREGDNATSDYTTDPTLAAPNTGQVVTVDELDRSWRDRAAARHDEATSDKRALSEQLAELERRHHAAGLDLPFEVRTAIRRKISVARRRIDDMGAGRRVGGGGHRSLLVAERRGERLGAGPAVRRRRLGGRTQGS
jgi:hypothetical protein